MDIPKKNPNPPDQYLAATFARESTWQANVNKTFADAPNFWRCYHTHRSDSSPEGFPDLHCVCPSAQVTLYAELKTESGTVTDLQKAWLLDCAEVTPFVYVWRPSDGDEIVEALHDVWERSLTLREESSYAIRQAEEQLD
jgi:hypothetical protein